LSVISEVLEIVNKIFKVVQKVVEEGSYKFILGCEENIDMNNHHVFAKTIKKTLGKGSHLLKKIDFDYTKEVPSRLHFNYNYVFAGDFLHTEVLGRLDQMLSKNFYVYNEAAINQTIEFFFYVHIYKYKGIKLEKSFKEIDDYSGSVWRVEVIAILDFFEIDRSDVIKYLEEFFFHPEYKKYDIKIMSELSLNGHTADREEKTGGNEYHKRYEKLKQK